LLYFVTRKFVGVFAFFRAPLHWYCSKASFNSGLLKTLFFAVIELILSVAFIYSAIRLFSCLNNVKLETTGWTIWIRYIWSLAAPNAPRLWKRSFLNSDSIVYNSGSPSRSYVLDIFSGWVSCLDYKIYPMKCDFIIKFLVN
jgi:hypothetical protein